MKKKLLGLMILTMLCVCLSACSNGMASNINSSKDSLSVSPSPTPSEVSLNDSLLKIVSPSPNVEEEKTTLTTDYFSITYDKNRVQISDNTSEQNKAEKNGCFYLMKYNSGDPLTSFAHVDFFGSEKIDLPKNFSKESWESAAKQIVANYYSENFDELNMAVYDTQISMERPESATTNISVKAIGTVPAINAKVCLQNGISKSVILVIVTYNNDTADMTAMNDALQTVKIK